MIISEKQIMYLISMAEQALSQSFFDEKTTVELWKFLNDIRDQQSTELKDIK